MRPRNATSDATKTFRKIAKIHDLATDTYLERIEFQVSETEVRKLDLLPSIVNEPKTFEKVLRDAGAILPKDDKDLRDVLRAVAKADAAENLVYAAQTGWLVPGQSFVTVNGVIGEVESSTIGVNRTKTINDPSGRLTKIGTWKSWREGVAELARVSSIFMFAICVAFAAPLLAIKNRPSFTICLFGRTRVGKSIATLVGASTIGIGRIRT